MKSTTNKNIALWLYSIENLPVFGEWYNAQGTYITVLSTWEINLKNMCSI
jgi:hypothetical protein